MTLESSSSIFSRLRAYEASIAYAHAGFDVLRASKVGDLSLVADGIGRSRVTGAWTAISSSTVPASEVEDHDANHISRPLICLHAMVFHALKGELRDLVIATEVKNKAIV